MGVGLLVWGAEAYAGDLLKAGRYAGFLKLPDAGMKIPAVLDTVYLPGLHGQKPKLAAYLKLSFGGFRSHEYLTHFYLVPDYDWAANEMILDAVATGFAKDLTVNARIEENGNLLVGKLRTARGVVRNGEIEMLYLSPSHLAWEEQTQTFQNPKVYEIFKDVPIMPLLTGSYQSKHPTLHTLQLEMTRQSGVISFGWLPMDGYVIRGRILGQSEIEPKITDAVLHSLNKFEDVEYNPFRAQVNFPQVGVQLGLGMCKRTVEGFTCGACQFKAIPEEKDFLGGILSNHCGFKIHPFPSEVSQGITITPSLPSAVLIESDYRGEIHLEERDVRRPFSIGINVTGPPVPNDPTIGKRDITFLPAIHLQPMEAGAQSVRTLPINLSLFQLEDKSASRVIIGPTGDALEIIQWTEKSIFGIFYAAGYGRVGTFRVYNEGFEVPSEKMSFAVPGTYLSKAESLPNGSDVKWMQTKLDLEWVTSASPLSPTPYNVGGVITQLWDVRSAWDGRNNFAMDQLGNLRFDAYTGIAGADFISGQSTVSLFMKIDQDEVGLVMSSDGFLNQPKTPYHQLQRLRRDEKYATPSLPEKKSLQKGMLHVFIPFDAVLYINDQRMTSNENIVHRVFALPKSIAREGNYRLRAQLKTGRSLTQKVKLAPGTLETEVFVTDFFALQDTP